MDEIREDLTQRLNRLERESRWWKLAGCLGALGLAAAVLMGQAMPGKESLVDLRVAPGDRLDKLTEAGLDNTASASTISGGCVPDLLPPAGRLAAPAPLLA